MQVCRLLVLGGLALVVSCASIEAGEVDVTPFAIKATDLTMPSHTVVDTSDGVTGFHTGSSEITVTGIPDDGTLAIRCWYSGPATQAKIPQQCGTVGLPPVRPVTGGKTFYGAVSFVPYGKLRVPGVDGFLQPRRAPTVSGHPAAVALALAGALMFGFGFRRSRLRWLALIVFVACVLAGALESSARGKEFKFPPMTPGAYQYTIAAGFVAESDATLRKSASTNVTLTVK